MVFDLKGFVKDKVKAPRNGSGGRFSWSINLPVNFFKNAG